MLLNIYKLALAGFTAFACFTGVSFTASAIFAVFTVLAGTRFCVAWQRELTRKGNDFVVDGG